ncbi:MAG: hypothetical protein M3384_01395 [Acidobacteriota bacterium]|nr:hypothetical protein [Acidobacteriota bacterium]
MFCSNCGSGGINPELNYCNRCGAKVSKPEAGAGKSVSENLSSALGYIGGFGFLGFIFVIIALVKNDVPVRALVAVSLFYLAALFGICYLILQQISASSNSAASGKLPAALIPDLRDNFQAGQQLNPADTAQLESPREPASDAAASASVTENTTKTLDEVLLKRN